MAEQKWERVFHYADPDLQFAVNEFIVECSEDGQIFRFGSDSGCSCYTEFDPKNFMHTHEFSTVTHVFGSWVAKLDNPVRAWEKFMDAKMRALGKTPGRSW
jgi:hypothetical protein